MNKSRQEKTKTPAQPAAPPPASNDIIPGRFTETDWHNMVEQEDGEEFAVDIVNEIVESTMKVLHEKYIISQTLPYTIQETKILLLQVIEWQFLACDLGEENPACDSTWLEEDEPVTPITDSWAQGSVPVLMRPSSASSISSVQSDRDSELPSVAEQRPGAPEPPFEALEISETPLSISSPAQPAPKTAEKGNIEKVPPPAKVQVQDKKRSRAPFKPHKGKLPTFSGVDLTSLTDDYVVNKQQSQQNTAEHVQSLDQNGLAMLSSSSSILKRSSENSSLTEFPSLSTFPTTRSWCGSQLTNLKAQQGRPPGIKDVLYDDRGNVVAVMKISPDKLPSHRVRTRFSVVDDDSEGSPARTRSRPRKLAPTAQRRETDKPSRSTRYNMDTGPVNNMPYRPEGSGEITPLPPPLVDTMDVSTGVVVREGKIVRRGPRQIPRRVEKTPSTAVLQPLVDTRPAGRVISDIVTRSSPVIRPLRATEPIPPIAPHPPTYS